MEEMRQLWDLKSNLIGIKALDKALDAFTKSTSLHTSHTQISQQTSTSVLTSIRVKPCEEFLFIHERGLNVFKRSINLKRKKCKHPLTLTVFIMLCLRKCKTENCFVVHKTMPTVTFHHRHAHLFQAFFFSFSAPHFFLFITSSDSPSTQIYYFLHN